MAYRAGSAYVQIRPDMRGLNEDVEKGLSGLDTRFAAAGDKAGKAFSGAFQDQLRASLANLPDARVTADADTAEAKAKLDELADKPRTATINVKTVADKVSGKTGTLGGLLNPVGIGAAAGVALGPSALGLTAGLAGIGAGFAAAAGDAGAFGAVAKGMFTDVTTAQAALTTATAAYNKATTDAGRASALKAEQAALAGLTPAEKQLATELNALSAAWKQLQKAEQPVVGAAIAPWLKTAIDGMGLLKPLISDGAQAIELLGNEADQALSSPFWQKFSSTFGQTGEEALQVFGTAAGQVADGLAHLFVAFAPDIDNLLPGIDKLTGAFDSWAKSVSDQGLNSFLTKTFSPANVHALATDGKELASFVEQVAKASQDMSPLAFAGLGNVMTILGQLTPGEIEALTGLFLAIKTIGTISAGVGALSSFVNGVKGAAGKIGDLFGTTGEAAAAGTADGEAFSGGFAKGSAAVDGDVTTVMAGLAEAGSVEAAGAGDALGASFAGGFAKGVGTIGEGLLDAAGVGAPEVLTAANGAGDALGASFAGGFAEGVGEIGGAIASALPEAGGLALLGTAAAGLAFGTAFGGGVVAGFALSGAKDVASGLKGDVKNATSGADTWLKPAGKDAADGFAAGFTGEASAVKNAAGQVKTWTQAGAAGSNTWIAPHGQQAAQGFASAFAAEHGLINSGAAALKGWVTSALPAPLSWLENAGVSVIQGFLNGLVSEAGSVYAEADSIAHTVEAKIQSALGINSPAKRMIPLGSAVPEGLAVGMEQGTAFVTSAGARLAGATASSLAGLAQAQSLAALGVPALPGTGSPAVRGASLSLQVTGSPGGTLDRLFLDWLQEMNSRGQLTLTTG
jgi:hypothetical protein